MPLPLTHTEFLDVFGAYNGALWPGAVLIWLITFALVLLRLARKPVNDRALSGLPALVIAGVSLLAYGFAGRRPREPRVA